MKKTFNLFFKNAEEVMSGIEKIAEDLFFEISTERCADYIIDVSKEDIDGFKVDFNAKKAIISYGNKKVCFFRGLMLLCQALSEEKNEFHVEESPHFKLNGVQIDLSRNNPLSIMGLEYFIRHCAIMGISSFVMYMEDMYEMPGYPYFGYMRGRYTQAELRALDDFADSLGVELCANIEVFAHLEKYLKYLCAEKIKGTDREILVGESASYEFIKDMMITMKNCFRSNRIYLGCDETSDANKGAYEKIHGQVPLEDVFYEHIAKVNDIALDLGFNPYISTDMYFHFRRTKPAPLDGYWYDDETELDEKVINGFPDGMNQVFWNYHEEDEDRMVRMMEKSAMLGGKMFWLGSVRSYQSLIMKYTPTIKNAIVGANACRRAGIEEITVSSWGDTGECPHYFMLPAMLIHAQLDYGDTYDEDDIQKKVRFLYDTDFEDFKRMELADQIHENDIPELATKFLLYNDPLFGLLDKNIEGMDLKKYYGNLVKDYKTRGSKSGPLKICFDQFKAMLDILELKADYGLRLKKAYDEGDKETLSELADEALIIKKRFEKLMEVDRELYGTYCMGFGLETIEMRRATMCARFETTKQKIEQYLSGKLSRIEELEQEKLPYCYPQWGNPSEENIFYGGSFQRIVSANN